MNTSQQTNKWPVTCRKPSAPSAYILLFFCYLIIIITKYNKPTLTHLDDIIRLWCFSYLRCHLKRSWSPKHSSGSAVQTTKCFLPTSIWKMFKKHIYQFIKYIYIYIYIYRDVFRGASCVPDALKRSWTHNNTSLCVPGTPHRYLRTQRTRMHYMWSSC